MSESIKSAVVSAVFLLLQPLVKLLLDAGIGVGEFNQIARRVYVRMARDRLAEGRPNVSRIAILTGLSRADVSAILTEPEGPLVRPERGKNRAEAVLYGWWTDARFVDDRGRPHRLPLRGARRSFASLVKHYAGGPRTSSILDELLRAKAIKQHPDGFLEVTSRTVANARWDNEGILEIGQRIRDVLETLIHNVKEPSRTRYDRVIESRQIDPRYVPMLMRDIGQQADVWADSFQDSLNDPKHNIKPKTVPQDARRLSIAIYVIEDETVVEAKASPAPKRKSRAS